MNFDLPTILGGAVGMIINFPIIILAFLAGRYSTAFWQVLVAATPIAVADRLLQSSFDKTGHPLPLFSDFLISAIVVAIVWASVFFQAHSRRRHRLQETAEDSL